MATDVATLMERGDDILSASALRRWFQIYQAITSNGRTPSPSPASASYMVSRRNPPSSVRQELFEEVRHDLRLLDGRQQSAVFNDAQLRSCDPVPDPLESATGVMASCAPITTKVGVVIVASKARRSARASTASFWRT